MRLMQNFLPHLCLILSAIAGVIVVLDFFNPTLGFVHGNLATTLLLVALCVAVLVNAASQIFRYFAAQKSRRWRT